MIPAQPRAQAPAAQCALLALNFFMADMQAGIGPFLGVFLLAHGWRNGMIGSVMSLGGIAGMLVTAPAGAFIDASSRKRLWVILPGICTVAASGLVLLSQSFWLVALSQAATAIAGAAIMPAVMGITLGMVRQAGFNAQIGRNQALNHAGNMVGAGLSGFLGWKIGFAAIFGLSALFAILSIASVSLIPAAAIDDRAARGLGAESDGGEASAFRVLAGCRPLLVLAACLFAFHLGNAAMLPLYGLAVVSAGKGNPAGFVAITIVVAQATMIPASLAAMWLSARRGYWLVLLVSFLSLPVRALVAAHLITHWGVYPVQMLDGVGAGLQSVAVPGLVARILNGTGHVNAGQGAVMTAQGVGAALSPALGGWMAQWAGYPASFLTLGTCAVFSVAVWIVCAGIFKRAAAADCGERAMGAVIKPGGA